MVLESNYIKYIKTNYRKELFNKPILEQKSYKTYDKLSRYANFPYYYNRIDNKYIYGTTSYLKDTTPYQIYTVKKNDTWDLLALENYNNPTYYWILLDFNRIQDPFVELKEGTQIKIPTLSSIEFEW